VCASCVPVLLVFGVFSIPSGSEYDACYALSDVCGHQRASLSKGRLEGYVLECPLHFARYDVRTGALLSGPVVEDIRCYAVYGSKAIRSMSSGNRICGHEEGAGIMYTKRGLGLLSLVGVLVVLLGVSRVAAQQAKAEFKLKLMGINRTLDPWKLYEEWTQSVEKRTNGRVQFELTSLPELGLGGAETIRVLKTGVVDVTETYGGYVAGELPIIEILEIPGIFPNPETAKKAILAWKPHEAKVLEEKANAVLLAMALYPDQAIWSKRPLRKLEDFKGLKIRVHSVALSSLVAGLGGEPLTIAFAEVYTALERGTLDAGISGTKPGYNLRWYEVSKYLVGPISMRPHVALAINKNTWKRLPPDIQSLMKEEAEKIVESKAFEAIEVWNKEGIEKSVEKGMEHLPFSPELQATIKEVLRTKVVPEWVKRAGGAEAARLFNDIIAPLVGFTVNAS